MMFARWLLAICVLPGSVLVLMPAGILWITRIGWNAPTSAGIIDAPAPIGPGEPAFWVAAVFLLVGLSLGLWTTSLFFRFGNGTPAPWDPPKRFVVRGPYRFVRNPMIIGAVVMLIAEALLFRSWPIAAWAGVFFLGNALYFPLVEERGLRERFGDKYVTYCRHVRRWIPRVTPWPPSADSEARESE